MLKQIKENTKNKSIIIVNIVLIAVLMVVAVYAWFASAADNRADAYEVEVLADQGLELSFDENTWSSTLNLKDLTDSSGNKVLENMQFKNITGNGESFRIPALTQRDGYAVVDTNKTWPIPSVNSEYLKFTVHMRSKDKLNVYLSSDSSAKPNSTTLVGANSGNKSAFGNFSKDCIVGALRVSYKNNANSRYIWIPRPDFHLDNEIGSPTYTMTTDATAIADGDGKTTFEWNNPYKHYYYASRTTTVTPATNALTTLPNTTGDSLGTDAAKTLLTSVSGTLESDGYYHSSAEFTVWIEGCDTEARRALVNGKFNLSLVFDSFEITS